MIRGVVCMLVVLAVILCARFWPKRGSAEDFSDGISNRIRAAMDDRRDFFARKRRDEAIMKKWAKQDLPPGSIEPAAKMPPQMPVPVRRRSRRRNRNVSR